MQVSWKPISIAPPETPLILFSLYDRDLNCKGGLIWVSGGLYNGYHWRGGNLIEPPTHWEYLPLPPIK